MFQIALFKGFPNIPHIPLPPEHSVGRNQATRSPTRENPESWHNRRRPREILQVSLVTGHGGGPLGCSKVPAFSFLQHVLAHTMSASPKSSPPKPSPGEPKKKLSPNGLKRKREDSDSEEEGRPSDEIMMLNVSGTDKKGITKRVTSILKSHHGEILDINQVSLPLIDPPLPSVLVVQRMVAVCPGTQHLIPFEGAQVIPRSDKFLEAPSDGE